MSEVLSKYLPEHAVQSCFELIKANSVHLKIVNERQTRHGDYRKGLSGKHEITVNANLNKYRFLITLVHEISHLVAFEKHGRKILPHGVEWKMTFQRLMVPFIRPEIFPHSVLSVDIDRKQMFFRLFCRSKGFSLLYRLVISEDGRFITAY